MVIATRQPLFSPPITLNSGARTPSRKSSQNSDAPDICRIGRYSTPGPVNGISTYESPACFSAATSVRHSRNIMVARDAPEVQTFCPVMTISSPSMTPRVSTDGQVAPVAGLGEALAVHVGAGDDPRQEPGTLLGRPVHDHRRADQ